MTWSTRIRLVIGAVLVLALCAALTLVLNRRTSQVTSSSATIRAEQLAIGTDYPGTVADSAVAEGDRVSSGDPLFTVQSMVLEHDLSVGVVTADSDAYEVDKDGSLTAIAPVDGVVTDVAVRPGGFARAGDVVTTVERSGSMYVDARVLLEPADFARIREGAEATIVLPDQSELSATVRSIAVRNTSNQAEATIEIVSDDLERGSDLAVPGTPVAASVELHDDGPLDGVDQGFRQFLRELGL
jgi:multidrug resistance efflux pump